MNAHHSTTTFTQTDEEEDARILRENLAREAFREWPNDAGFDGLTEHRGPIELQVEGNIPAWATGSLYRTGPGACKIEDTKSGTIHVSHWFDGLAHTHRFDIMPAADGNGVRVMYSSRRQSEAFEKEIRAMGVIRALTFGQRSDPCVGIYSKFMSMFRRPEHLDNICVTVNANMPGFPSVVAADASSEGHRAGPKNVFLATDTSWFSEIDPKTMEPMAAVSQKQLHPDLRGPVGPAHVLQDPETGDFFSFNADYGMQATYRVFQITARGEVKILATFASKAGYIHSFFLSRSYVIVCVPVAHYKLGGIQILWEGSALEAWKPFDPSEPCRWFVVDRVNGEGVVAEFTSPAGFFFHSANAFEDTDGDILCDLIAYPNSNIVSGMYYDVLLNRNEAAKAFWTEGQKQAPCHPSLVRYRFSGRDFGKHSGKGELPSPALELQIPAPHAGDMPTINPAFACRQHRYVYCLTSRGLSTIFDSIARVDTQTREVLMWKGPIGHTPSEALFVSRKEKGGAVAPADELDGVLLTVVLDGENRKSYLLCLDPKTMTEMGRAECEFAVGLGFHGQHVVDI
ncbi:uncharacterized protein E0L32_002123 [Thyridium curvatum]|uniref:Uncharacterized protein n=1 Tax=Thyridium curvatum TaxID=1093900 RepID=A0A507ATI4_9PEZI|nr:uncharacterized protein E0L32_002010 [Thyridium curvatum]XP_030989231.1 uncharacterized protein E0L32_002123 [Thyridium curvatum]TPX07407.1 hypothetical protein E0L32_002010 [Thyridium curvatum]TPX07520.1 hypothetical protein E0L32_002123 [Thyridium curvatum]